MTQSFRFEVDRLTEQGHTAAAARLLRAQLSRGGLSSAQLNLAAFLGHTAAREVVDYQPSVLETCAGVSRLTKDTAWVNGLLQRCLALEPRQGLAPGKEPLLLATAAVSRLALGPRCNLEPADEKAWSVFLTAMECWLMSPSEEGQLTALGTLPIGFHQDPGQTLSRALFVLLSNATAFQLPTVTEHEGLALSQALLLDPEAARAAVASALLPWCLWVDPRSDGRSGSSLGFVDDQENGALL